MTMLTASELAQLRLDIAELMPDTCTISKPGTPGSDEHGFPNEGTRTEITGVACRLDPIPTRAGAGEGVIASRELARAFYQLTVAYDANLADSDKIIMGGVTYEVVQMHGAHTHRLSKRAIVAKVDGN